MLKNNQTGGRPLFISWAEQNGRTEGLAGDLHVPAVFLGAGSGRVPAALRYPFQAIRTVRVLLRARPRVVLTMLPPFPLLVICLVWAFFGRKTVIADAHTGFFLDPKWSRWTDWSLRRMRGRVVIVTNEELAQRVESAGARPMVLHDRLIPAPPEQSRYEGFVLGPFSYASDEPIHEVLEAAAQLPDVTFVLTGRPPAAVRESAGENVKFPGFVSDDEYVRLLSGASVVLALVTTDHTMQRAGYEALMHRKPQVTSHFDLLRSFLADAAVYVDPRSPRGIAEGVKRALEWSDAELHAVERRLDALTREQDTSLGALRALIRDAG